MKLTKPLTPQQRSRLFKLASKGLWIQIQGFGFIIGFLLCLPLALFMSPEQRWRMGHMFREKEQDLENELNDIADEGESILSQKDQPHTDAQSSVEAEKRRKE